MQTSNPAFSGDIFSDWAHQERRASVMTVQGTALKALVLLALLSATAAWSWTQSDNAQLRPALLMGSLIGGLVVFFITLFKKQWSPFTAPLYAGLEGVLLGAISSMFNQQYPGIAIQAVSLTIGTLFVMLFIYATGLIRVTPRLTAAIVAATGAICLVYLVSIVLSMFGRQVPFIHGATPSGIAFSVFVVGLAAFNLLLDFDFIEKGARSEQPKYMEWYAAFGLMVTLIWLYLEILRLLRKLQDRR